MKNVENTKSYTAAELKAMKAKSRTDLSRVDAMTDAALEKIIAEDHDEKGIDPDWTKAKLILPRAKQSVHLRLEEEIIAFFKAQGRGHISRMQAVLKAYADAHKPAGRP